MRTPIYRSRPVEPNPARFDSGQRINDFITLSEAFSNVYRIDTGAGCIQLNAGMGMEAPVIDANLNALSDQPVHTLILTQGHVDHVGGVGYFREKNPGLNVIASANNGEHQAYDGRLGPFRGQRSAFAFTTKFAAAFEHYQQHGYTEFAAQDAPTPDTLVEDRLTLTFDQLEVEIIALPGAETNDSVIVWLPQQRICFTGNLFGCPFGHFPNLVTIRGDRYRDALTVAHAVDTVRALQPEMILYGHHGPVTGRELIQQELTALHDAIHYVHDKTVEGMNAGKTVHQLMNEIRLPPEMEVGEGYGKVSWSVRAIWENYAGWFHHDSTTELYSVPASDIHADLVALTGSGALLQLAERKLAEDKPEQALHILDMVLNAEPSHVDAIALASRAHEHLLTRTDNFWLRSWLTHRIATLQQRLDSHQ